MPNSTFKGLFNYYQQTFELFTIATSERVAHGNFMSQLTKKTGKSWPILRFYFDGSVDNFSINKIKGEENE